MNVGDDSSASEESSDSNDETTEVAEPSEAGDEVENSIDSDEDNGIKDESKEDKPKKKGGFQKRIERANAKLTAAQQETEYWKQQALKNQPDQKPVESKSESISKPKAENFDSHEEYVEALTDWKLEEREKKNESLKKQNEVKTQFQNQVQTFQSKVQEFKKSNEDFDEVLESVDDIPLSVGFQEALITSDFGPQVMYELAKNPKELERINALSPIVQAREIGKLEARFAQSVSAPAKEIKQTTKATSPISTLGNGSASMTKSLSDPNISFAEYEKVRMQQIKQKNKGQ